MSPTRIPLILGAGGFGKPGGAATRTTDVPSCQEQIDIFIKEQGHKYIDTSRVYGGGTSEEFLAQCDVYADGEAVIDTKVNPLGAGNLKAESVRGSLLESVKALGGKKIRIFYLHAPHRPTPLEETAEAVNSLYKEGYFEEFGLSNYAAFEVAQIWTICKERGYILPTVYQGVYNLIQRASEPELFHALRIYKIRFAAWSPLAGGLLTGNVKSKDAPVEKGSRYDPDSHVGKLMRKIFLSGSELEACQYLEGVVKKHNLTTGEVALRWLQHHSALTPDDYVIIGGSKAEHIKSNCVDSAKGPLPDEVVEAAETAWLMVKARAALYFLPFGGW